MFEVLSIEQASKRVSQLAAVKTKSCQRTRRPEFPLLRQVAHINVLPTAQSNVQRNAPHLPLKPTWIFLSSNVDAVAAVRTAACSLHSQQGPLAHRT